MQNVLNFIINLVYALQNKVYVLKNLVYINTNVGVYFIFDRSVQVIFVITWT